MLSFGSIFLSGMALYGTILRYGDDYAQFVRRQDSFGGPKVNPLEIMVKPQDIR
jgi:hypothetical protein